MGLFDKYVAMSFEVAEGNHNPTKPRMSYADVLKTHQLGVLFAGATEDFVNQHLILDQIISKDPTDPDSFYGPIQTPSPEACKAETEKFEKLFNLGIFGFRVGVDRGKGIILSIQMTVWNGREYILADEALKEFGIYVPAQHPTNPEDSDSEDDYPESRR